MAQDARTLFPSNVSLRPVTYPKDSLQPAVSQIPNTTFSAVPSEGIYAQIQASTRDLPTVESDGGSSGPSKFNALPSYMDTGRSAMDDFKIPKWLKGIKPPFEYARCFMGRYGLVNYELSGTMTGDLVICNHGLNGARGTFSSVAQVLDYAGFLTLTFDLYGHGLSAAPTFIPFGKIYSREFFCDQIVEILQHLNLSDRKLILIGYSMGALISITFAERFPEKVKKVILLAPAGMLQNKPAYLRILEACQCFIPCAHCCVSPCCFKKEKMLEAYTEEELMTGVPQALYDRITWQFFVRKGVVGAILGCVTKMPLWSAQKLFAKVGTNNFPIFVIGGRDDQIVAPLCVTRVAESFSNSHLIVLPNTGHLLLGDRPRAVCSLIITFLEFPDDCKMNEWSNFFPYDENGSYRPVTNRAPKGQTFSEFQKHLGYKNKFSNISNAIDPRKNVEVCEPAIEPKSAISVRKTPSVAGSLFTGEIETDAAENWVDVGRELTTRFNSDLECRVSMESTEAQIGAVHPSQAKVVLPKNKEKNAITWHR
eukprot:GHVP01051241.1.p1 GENE.GHVP01051241.1~~GHVP01051241.1.p1  ORF type:complete len:538 (+),score=73.12 GHVP01051241.1:82-1695(+)